MLPFWKFLTLSAVVCLAAAHEAKDGEYGINEDLADKEVFRAVVESCGGWRLNSLPEVKAFIFNDLPLFHNLEFVRIGGHNPDLVMLNAANETVERIDLASFNREECNNLLIKKGFYRKQSADEEVPEKFLTGPYKVKEEL